MPKTFYTEHEIEDMVKRGTLSLEVGEDVVLTDLAYEKARTLGMVLTKPGASVPPAAPVRPYLSSPPVSPAAQNVAPPKPDEADLRKRIHAAVTARLGAQVDTNLLDVIITRVLNSTGLK